MLKELTGEKKDKKFRRILGKDYLQAEEIVPQLKNAFNGYERDFTFNFGEVGLTAELMERNGQCS